MTTRTTRKTPLKSTNTSTEIDMGSIDEVSKAIGSIQSDVTNLKNLINDAEVARSEMSKTLTSIQENVTTLVANFITHAAAMNELKEKVSDHERTMQRSHGIKSLLVMCIGSGGMLAIWESLHNLFSNK